MKSYHAEKLKLDISKYIFYKDNFYRFIKEEDKISRREAFNYLPTKLQRENAVIIRI